jgi:alpha,alpha-trehalase
VSEIAGRRVENEDLVNTPNRLALHYRDLAPGETCQFRLLNPDDRDRDENRAMKAAKEAPR